MGSGFSKKKKQMQNMQAQFAEVQASMKNMEVLGSAGNGLVTITLNGDNEIKKIAIKKECVDPEDIEGLEDLILAAHQDATTKLQQSTSNQMPDLSSFGF